ncbi:MAG: hypothetical protein N4A33_11655 [Bacteriovoracaceae bacterium]|jgi:hypothetical protein|nr:hypothetical protein [Bacteriovoracaceae bacterium]
MAKCKFCGTEIMWMQEGRKKVPVEMDGAKHECEEYKRTVKSARKIELNEIDPDILKQYQDAINKKK